MTKEDLLHRIEEIKISLEHSSANHNSLVGRLQEAQFMLHLLENKNTEIKED